MGKVRHKGMQECIFCKIINGEIPSEIIFESEKTIAIKDINPQAPVHLLVLPKEHIETLNNLQDKEIMADLLSSVQKITQQLKLAQYRTVINTGRKAGQDVFHLHLHVLGGRQMLWPPG